MARKQGKTGGVSTGTYDMPASTLQRYCGLLGEYCGRKSAVKISSG
jgi:hypothetical protein